MKPFTLTSQCFNSDGFGTSSTLMCSDRRWLFCGPDYIQRQSKTRLDTILHQVTQIWQYIQCKSQFGVRHVMKHWTSQLAWRCVLPQPISSEILLMSLTFQRPDSTNDSTCSCWLRHGGPKNYCCLWMHGAVLHNSSASCYEHRHNVVKFSNISWTFTNDTVQ